MTSFPVISNTLLINNPIIRRRFLRNVSAHLPNSTIYRKSKERNIEQKTPCIKKADCLLSY